MKDALRLPSWLSGLRLYAEIWLLRQGGVALVGWLLLLGAGLGWLMLDQARQHETELTARLARANAIALISPSQASAGPVGNAAKLAALYDVLTPASTRNQALTSLFDIAADEGWDIAEADYNINQQRSANLERLQIALPLQGNYPDIRDLAEALLRGKPNLSLDDISFKRENAEADVLKATLKISLWSRLDESPGAPVASEVHK
ncbi:hypothetical protein [Chitinimonas sp. BJB300]|uniref:hypothetical protein n=1 Tax=Chitinimonas sp. BJB300 TaxID=1559339 RepID=UPI000C1038B6|nr:hypothetical protein [Chitinimonas sp. BJB300]PHV11008.1 hypothetical protein CSQ89_13175 [Chitinimonas sp. BJB300]TSJ87011.1 hypothetical protein FG002_015645 [Chitinimonas sp. BJB300]